MARHKALKKAAQTCWSPSASEKSQAIKDTYNPNGWTKDMYNPRYDFLSAGILINFDF